MFCIVQCTANVPRAAQPCQCYSLALCEDVAVAALLYSPPSPPLIPFFLTHVPLTSPPPFDVCVCHWSCIAPVACHRQMCILGARLYRLRSLHCGPCAAVFVCTLFSWNRWVWSWEVGCPIEVSAVWHISHLQCVVITATVLDPSAFCEGRACRLWVVRRISFVWPETVFE